MNDDVTTRLGLPLLYPGQAQKELTHNEALALLDLAVGGEVEAVGVDTPPAMPLPGQAWVVGTAPTGAWAGHAGAVAAWTAGGWRFLAPCDGFVFRSRADGVDVRRVSGEWESGVVRAHELMIGGARVVGARRPAIGAPAGGATIDGEARGAIGSILATLRGHGLIAE